MYTHIKKKIKLISYIWGTRKFTTFLRQAAWSLFYFPQNAIHFLIIIIIIIIIIIPPPVQIIYFS